MLALLRLGDGSRSAVGTIAALLGHGALLVTALQQAPAHRASVEVTEVEWLPPAPPAPPPPPPPRMAEEPREAPASRPHAPRQAAPRAPVPPAASAAPLRTIADSAPTRDEPVRFVSDPTGSAFGYGMVQRGGVASVGTATAAPVASRDQGPAPVLSRAPRLGESEPCRGFFPARAQVDRGEAALKVRIEADGSVRAVSVVREAPSGQGFGSAARECLLSKHFSPALDLAGRPVSVLNPVTVRFSR